MDFRCDYCDKKMKLNDKAIYSDRLNSYYCSLKCLFDELDLKVDTVNEFIADEARDFYEGKKLGSITMARAVYRKNKDGKVTYVGHVPPEYKLKDNEFFEKLPNVRSN